MFLKSVDKIEKQINCTRAKEEPEDNNGKWSATIPRCRNSNAKCNIHKFFMNYLPEIEQLNETLTKTFAKDKTKELEKIHEISKQFLKKQKFEKGKISCRQIGDLLIGLESKVGECLISSNKKEHSILSNALGYNFKYFDFVQIRSK